MSTDNTEQQVIASALAQVDKIMNHFNARSDGNPGYYTGYELGYAKGVLEHFMRNCPDLHLREPYVKGYITGYAQGILYALRQRACYEQETADHGTHSTGDCVETGTHGTSEKGRIANCLKFENNFLS